MGNVIEIIAPAVIVSGMIALTHAPLGIEVLRRGIIFIDLAIAQVAGLGVITASLLFHDAPWWAVQSSALSAALVAAVFFRWIEQRWPLHQEALIGVSFIVAASLALLLLSHRPHGGDDLTELLSGQILFVTWRDVAWHAPLYLAVVSTWFFWPTQARTTALFYLLFALAITSSVQLVGVYVVFASLILPALAAHGARHPHPVAWSCGLGAIIIGIGAALVGDLPAGPVLVLAYAVVAGTISFVRARRRALRSSKVGSLA